MFAIILFITAAGFAKQPEVETIELGLDGKVTFSTGAVGKKGDLLVKTSSADDGIEVEVSLSRAIISKLVAEDGKIYDRLSITGCGLTAEQVGLPEMPFKGFFLEIPYGVDISVEVREEELVTIGFGYNIYPLQPALPDSGSEHIDFTINETAYSTNAFYPAEPIVINPPGFIRGRRVVFVQVFPFQYNPADREVRTFKKLMFKLKFEGTKEELRGIIRKRRLRTHQFEKLAESLILNYEAQNLKEDESSTEKLLLPESQGADYLIVAADNFYEEIQPLADWKYKKGYITYVAKFSEVGSTAADVKSYIQNAYDNWSPAPSFVLLVGDSEDVPPDYYYGEKECVSDYPYSCVDGSDYYPDLMLGRLPVHTESECSVVVNKILEYDRWPESNQWYDDFLAAAYFQDNGNDSGEIDDDGYADRWFMETAMTIYNFMVNTLGWDGHTALCTSHWPLTYSTDNYHFDDGSYAHRGTINQQSWGCTGNYPDPVPTWVVELWTSHSQATSDISAAINAGVNIVLHRDHGGETSWGDPSYNVSNINALTNGRKTPVVLSINCNTGSFYRTGGDCFCEAFLKKANGGAVGITGATRVSYSGYNDLLAHGFFTCLWPSYDTTHTDATYPHSRRPAEALNYAKYYMLTYKGDNGTTEAEFHMFHWFGDPEMPLYTSDPCTMYPAYQDMIAFGHQSFVVETGVPGALVCLSKPDEFYISGYADGTGHFDAEIEALFAFEPMDITITAQNYHPHEDQVPVSTTEGDLYPDGNIDNNDLKVISAHWLEDNRHYREDGDLSGWWEFDEGDGNTAADSSGYGNTGTLYNEPNWQEGILEFDGVDDYVQTAYNANKLQLTGNYTWAVWLKADSTQADWATIFNKYDPNTAGPGNNHWSLQFGVDHIIDTSGKIVVWNGAGFMDFWDTQIELSEIAGGWHHIAVVRSQNIMTSYLDGDQVNWGTYTTNPISGEGHLNIGADRRLLNFYKGLIGDVSIYDYQLTSDEVRELSLEHPVGQLVGWWNFDDGTADDSSGNNRHGTLVQSGGGTSVNIVYDADRDSNVLDVNNPAGHTINSVVDCGGAGDWADIRTQISVAAWLKVDTFHVANQYLLTKGNTYQLTRSSSTDTMRTYMDGLSDTALSSSATVNDGSWHYVVVTYDSDLSERIIYIDGVNCGSDTPSGLLNVHTESFVIGGRLDSSFDDRGWDGRVDDVRLYDYVLSRSAVRWLYEGSPASEPVGYLCFERPIGDINGDCKVDLLDYAILALYWMESEGGS